MTSPPPEQPSPRAAALRLLALAVGLAAVWLVLYLSGWNGPEELQSAVRAAGWAGAAVFVVGYAVLVLLPTPASVLTILGGALFGLWWGVVLAWAGALLGAIGGFLIGRRLGRPAVDRLLAGRLAHVDAVLSDHGFVAVVAVRLVPVFPYAPLNYAAGLLGVRVRDYVAGTAVGIVPVVIAYVAVGASGADPRQIAIGVGGLVVLALLGGVAGRRMSTATAQRRRHMT